MNKILLIGNLTKDPELRVTTTNKKVANFTIAVNDGENAYYFNCIAWNKTGEAIEQYCKKGNKIAIEGKLTQRKYETQYKQSRVLTEIVVENVDFLTPKSEKDFDTETDDDLPF